MNKWGSDSSESDRIANMRSSDEPDDSDEATSE